MKRDYLEEFLPDLGEFKDKTMKFHNKEISVAEYKGFSGGFGSYAQRGGEKHMLRLRMAGGRMTKSRLAAIADICRKYDVNKLKLTTCQSVQMHNLEAADLCEMIEEVWMADMISRGGGGDFPRNVMASPLSGVEKDENFNVLPYAEAMSAYLMQFIKTVKLPRKLKVAFSNSTENVTHATFRDLGFVSNPDGTFDVYAAGGLGNKPRLGVCVGEHVDPSKILYYAKAMIETFMAHGDYTNRAKARTRYMQEKLGVDGFKAEFHKYLEQVNASEQLDLSVSAMEMHKKGNGSTITDKRIVPQKQEGLYAVLYHPVGGDLPVAKLSVLNELIKDMDEVECRVTPDEGMYIINCNADEAKKVLDLTADSAADLFETSIACIGNSICQVGARDSQQLLRDCVKAVREEHFADGVLPRIAISGCPSSCAAHQVCAIGFRGAVKQTDDGPKPAFALFMGGEAKQGKESITDTEIGRTILIEEIPAFLVELGRIIAASHLTYDMWIKEHQCEMDALVQKYI